MPNIFEFHLVPRRFLLVFVQWVVWVMCAYSMWQATYLSLSFYLCLSVYVSLLVGKLLVALATGQAGTDKWQAALA